MLTPAVMPRSPFIPRTGEPPYSHVENSTRAEVDRLELTALSAMVDVEPYGSSDLGGDPSDDEPPSMTSASPSDEDPEEPENTSGRKKQKKMKTKRPEGRRSQEAKATATSKIVVNLPEFTGKNLREFAENFGRFLRMTGQIRASGRVKCDLLLQCCKAKYLEKKVCQILTRSATFADVLVALERQYPNYKTQLSIRAEIQNLAVLPNNPRPARISELLADLDHWVGRLTPGSYGSDKLLFWLVAKLPRELWDDFHYLSLTLQAPYVLQVDHGDGWESVPLEQSEHTSSYLRVCKREPSTMMVASRTEDYQLLGDVLDQGLREFGYSREELNVELFASDKQHVLDLYCSKGKNCCYKLYWPSLAMAYGNPRFSELRKVLTKVALERSCMILCSPDWGAHGGNEYWRTLLDKLTLTPNQLPDDAIYVPLGRKTPIRKPGWGSMPSVADRR